LRSLCPHWTPTSPGTTRRESKCHSDSKAPCNTVVAWDSLLNQSKFLSAPPLVSFGRAPTIRRHHGYIWLEESFLTKDFLKTFTMIWISSVLRARTVLLFLKSLSILNLKCILTFSLALGGRITPVDLSREKVRGCPLLCRILIGHFLCRFLLGQDPIMNFRFDPSFCAEAA